MDFSMTNSDWEITQTEGPTNLQKDTTFIYLLDFREGEEASCKIGVTAEPGNSLHLTYELTSAPTWWLLRRTTCCHTFLSSSILTGLMRKSTAPWVTPRKTTGVSPLEDITAKKSTSSSFASIFTTSWKFWEATNQSDYQHLKTSQLVQWKRLWLLHSWPTRIPYLGINSLNVKSSTWLASKAGESITYDWNIQLQGNCFKQLEAIHICQCEAKMSAPVSSCLT